MGGPAEHPTPEGACGLSPIGVDETEMFAFNLLKPFWEIALRVLWIEGFFKIVRDVIS